MTHPTRSGREEAISSPSTGRGSHRTRRQVRGNASPGSPLRSRSPHLPRQLVLRPPSCEDAVDVVELLQVRGFVGGPILPGQISARSPTPTMTTSFDPAPTRSFSGSGSARRAEVDASCSRRRASRRARLAAENACSARRARGGSPTRRRSTALLSPVSTRRTSRRLRAWLLEEALRTKTRSLRRASASSMKNTQLDPPLPPRCPTEHHGADSVSTPLVENCFKKFRAGSGRESRPKDSLSVLEA
jgi:hypothetical protein